MPVGDGAHHTAHGEAVEVIVDEDQAAQHDGGQLSAHPALDVLLGPAAESGGAARLVHQAHHGAQDDQEDQDAHVVAVRQDGDDAVAEHVDEGALKGKVGVEQAAHQDADEQGGVDLLGDQGQGDGDDRGQQGEGGVVKAAGGLDIAGPAAGGTHIAPAAGLALWVQAVAHHTGGAGAAVGTLDHLAARLVGGVGGEDGGGQGQQQHDHQHRPCDPGASRSHRNRSFLSFDPHTSQLKRRSDKRKGHGARFRSGHGEGGGGLAAKTGQTAGPPG